jgi:hypothetical protein
VSSEHSLQTLCSHPSTLTHIGGITCIPNLAAVSHERSGDAKIRSGSCTSTSSDAHRFQFSKIAANFCATSEGHRNYVCNAVHITRYDMTVFSDSEDEKNDEQSVVIPSIHIHELAQQMGVSNYKKKG